ncbi:hypothetical protein KUTeg_019805 [Tegillarca granosa]|uniref:Tumor protein p53-inducible nuclear protein 1 n=1 Tax=Tegillarca granosa TaxID=220873 RepID=A0ABQ9EDI6_TEGGR|nr:hypothetical protein KUTeg_019805 [Tegillarca granosa]
MFTSVANYLFGSSEAATEKNEVELKESPADHDESWTVVDLPGGTSSSQVQMTPMENLLIEHPSMSVYNSHCSGGSAGEESDLSSSDSASQNVAKRELRPRTVKGLGSHQPPRRPNAVAARAGLIAHIESVKSSQKVKQYNETRRLTRKGLERVNKIYSRQIPCRPRVPKSLKQCPSVGQKKH